MSSRLEILGIPVDKVTMNEAIDILERLLKDDECSLIVTPNSEIIYNAYKKDAELANIIRNAELVIPDGAGLVYASKVLGSPFEERVTGIDFLGEALKILAKDNKSIYIFGAAPGVADKAAQEMKKAHPGLVIAGARNGYFKEDEEEAIVQDINSSGADLLCVALGSPKQEKFIQKYKSKLNVKAAVGVGGSLDVWAGEVSRAPEFFQNHGLEWLYRLAKEPKRIKRMAALPLFVLRVKFGGGKNE